MDRRGLLLCLIVAPLGLPACGESGGRDPGRLRIGVSIPAAKTGWTAGLGSWAEKAMDEHPDVDWVYLRAATPARQTSQIESMMARGIDGLVLLATESAPITTIAKNVKKRGIYLYSVDRGLTEPVADVFLEGDNHGFGRIAAEFMVEKLGGQGDIVVLTGVPCTVDTYRVEGAMEVFDRHDGIRILDRQPTDWETEKAMKVMHSMLTRFDHIDAVWAQDDASAVGAAQAIEEAGRQGEMWVMGGAGRKDVVKEVMEGNPMFPADVTYSPAMIAAGIHLCLANLRDGNEKAVFDLIPPHLGMTRDLLRDGTESPVEGQHHLKLPVHLITPENAEEHYFPESVY